MSESGSEKVVFNQYYKQSTRTLIKTEHSNGIEDNDYILLNKEELTKGEVNQQMSLVEMTGGTIIKIVIKMI